jgi:hypothetical protein
VNGQCLTWSSQGLDHYYGDVTVDMKSTPVVTAFAQDRSRSVGTKR